MMETSLELCFSEPGLVLSLCVRAASKGLEGAGPLREHLCHLPFLLRDPHPSPCRRLCPSPLSVFCCPSWSLSHASTKDQEPEF